MRQTVVAGNWKMNKTPNETTELINELKPLVAESTNKCIVCVPYTSLANAIEATKGSNIEVGAQNMYYEESGAYTGEISPSMLCEMGVKYVIIGHSERRQYFAETDETVNKKVIKAFEHNLTPIICVGETLEQRKQGITKELLSMQTKIALKDVTVEELKNVIIAYEPVWAIGTGETATADQADEGNKFVRDAIADMFGAEVAETVTIQYGGSMNAGNADELLSKVNVDGGLIGGASLKAEDFSIIVKAASK